MNFNGYELQGVTISNDGATIMKLLDIVHPAAKSLVNISMSQDAEASHLPSGPLQCGFLCAAQHMPSHGLSGSVVCAVNHRQAVHMSNSLSNTEVPS